MRLSEAQQLTLLAELHNLSPALSWIKDAQHRLIYTNNAFCELFGIALDSWLGKTAWDLFPEEQARQIADNDRRVQEQQQAQQATEVISIGDSTRHYLSWKYPMPQPDGAVFIGGVSIDVTAQVQAEQALAQSVKNLQHSTALRQRMLGLFSHDVRSPLANIVDVIRALRSTELPLAAATRERLLTLLDGQAQDTLEMLDSILEWVMADREACAAPVSTISLGELIDQALRGLRQGAVTASDLDIPVRVIPSLMVRVLRNVLNSAIAYSPEGAQIAVSAETRGDHALLHIDDEGAGIPDEVLAQFAAGQLPPPGARARGEQGRTTGLVLCLDLLRHSGATLQLSRRAEGGTRSTISMPLCAAPAVLRRLAYRSTAREGLTDEDLAGLLSSARAHNLAHGIGGVLLYSGSHFFQVIEGSPQDIDVIMERIVRSTKHHSIEVLLDIPVEQAGYQQWSMMFSRIAPARLDQLDPSRPETLQSAIYGLVG